MRTFTALAPMAGASPKRTRLDAAADYQHSTGEDETGLSLRL